VHETGDVIGFRQQLSTMLFEPFELEITVNYPVHTWTKNGSLTRNLTSWSVPFSLFVLPTEHEVLHCYAPNAVYHCMVAGQLYPSCMFPSIDCRCFQVFNPSWEIHATAFCTIPLNR